LQRKENNMSKNERDKAYFNKDFGCKTGEWREGYTIEFQ
jgi:hypothetical protein